MKGAGPDSGHDIPKLDPELETYTYSVDCVQYLYTCVYTYTSWLADKVADTTIEME